MNKHRNKLLMGVLGLFAVFYVGDWLLENLLEGPLQARRKTRTNHNNRTSSRIRINRRTNNSKGPSRIPMSLRTRTRQSRNSSNRKTKKSRNNNQPLPIRLHRKFSIENSSGEKIGK